MLISVESISSASGAGARGEIDLDMSRLSRFLMSLKRRERLTLSPFCFNCL